MKKIISDKDLIYGGRVLPKNKPHDIEDDAHADAMIKRGRAVAHSAKPSAPGSESAPSGPRAELSAKSYDELKVVVEEWNKDRENAKNQIAVTFGRDSKEKVVDAILAAAGYKPSAS